MMTVIQPNCRVQFTAEDLAFMLGVMGRRGDDAALGRLLADEESRDLILDDPALLRAVLEGRQCLRLSAHFYFYLLVRHAFRRGGLAERLMADYVASVLAAFAEAERTQARLPGRLQPTEYFVDMLAALEQADDITRFHLRVHMGNYSLFLSGVFPDRIRFRADRRGAPGLSYYEELGRCNFRAASDHRLARRYELDGIFHLLADRFQQARRALNDLGERLVSLGDPEPHLPVWAPTRP
jgi:GNAT superfamily N-acetyltransferase